MGSKLSLKCIFGLIIFFISMGSLAQTKVFNLILKNHIFTPSELIIPANEKVKLIIINKDSMAEEFDSFDLNREKVLFPNRSVTIFIGPLDEGEYEYFGEYNPNSARGIITVEVSDVD